MGLPSTKPYLLRAIWEWCCDNGFTPYIAVQVDLRTRVPREFINDGQIVLNIGPDATSQFQIGNELIEFQARFGGVSRNQIGTTAAVDAPKQGKFILDLPCFLFKPMIFKGGMAVAVVIPEGKS